MSTIPNRRLKQKSAGSVLLPVPSLQGIWHSRYIVERVTQSLRRMTYTPKQTCFTGKSGKGYNIHTRDIYRYFTLDDAIETARFLKRSRIKRSKRF